MNIKTIFSITFIFVLLITTFLFIGSDMKDKGLLSNESQKQLREMEEDFDVNFNAVNADSEAIEGLTENVKGGDSNSSIFQFLKALEWLYEMIKIILRIVFMPGFIFSMLGIKNTFLTIIEGVFKYGMYLAIGWLIFNKVSGGN